eukprot:scaffold39402_cov34-Phaeocystis_antarctica.AAC.3
MLDRRIRTCLTEDAAYRSSKSSPCMRYRRTLANGAPMSRPSEPAEEPVSLSSLSPSTKALTTCWFCCGSGAFGSSSQSAPPSPRGDGSCLRRKACHCAHGTSPFCARLKRSSMRASTISKLQDDRASLRAAAIL